MEKLRHGSLFSGIGGFDLAAEWMGWENVFHCEWMEFGQKVLKHYWPQAESFSDITKTDFTKYYGTVDIITGGFPCQPYSSAGKRKGKEDERHLWPEMLRAIREVSPRFVVGENVRGLTNWNGGLVFDEVCAELESLGYQVAPVIIPACGLGAPHKRERIWFVAYAESFGSTISKLGKSESGQQIQARRDIDGSESLGVATNTNGSEHGNYQRANNSEAKKIRRENKGDVFTEFCGNGDATDSYSERQTRERKQGIVGKTRERGKKRFEQLGNSKYKWEKFPTQYPVCGGDDGLPTELDRITFPKWRNESIKAYGNAIVPQVAYEIFKALEKSLYL